MRPRSVSATARKTFRDAGILYRYTDLVRLFDMLEKSAVSLVGPERWDDQNDASFLARYKELTGAKTLLALCFCEQAEMFHHWRVFASKIDAVRVEFSKPALLKFFQAEGFRFKRMKYEAIDSARNRRVLLEELPFLKRAPYRDEREFRIVYESSEEAVDLKQVRIDLRCIRRVTIGPWVPQPMARVLKTAIKDVADCRHIKVHSTTVLANKEWMSVAKKVVLTQSDSFQEASKDAKTSTPPPPPPAASPPRARLPRRR